jgi:hypothetical protein
MLGKSSRQSAQCMGLIILMLYVAYLLKSAMGINLSEKYTAWDFLKYPVKSYLDRSHG